MNHEDRYGAFTPMRATKFYFPLLLQAFFQSLTYPLVASIVTHGSYGVDALTAFAQGQIVMFMIGAIGGGLVMTGMVFAVNRAGYRSFVRMNNSMMLVLLAVQFLVAMPPFDKWVFIHVLNLPPELSDTACRTLLWGFVMQAGFFLRNIPLVLLFNARDSFRATIATVARIVLTVAAPLVFIPLGWTGAMWGLVAMTVPCMVELFLTWYYARPYERELSDDGTGASVITQLRFTMPLAIGGFLLASSPFLVSAFIGRAENSVAMLAIHYVTIGLANPVGYGAFRMQPVALQFPPEYPGDHRVVRYAIAAGAVLGVIPFVTSLPFVGRWYFGVVQNVPAEDIHLACIVMALYALWPVVQTVRGHAEGHAAYLKKPSAVLAGQVAYVAVLTITLFLSLTCGMPGWLMGFAAIMAASIAAMTTVKLSTR